MLLHEERVLDSMYSNISFFANHHLIHTTRYARFGNLPSGRFCYSFSETGGVIRKIFIDVTFHNKAYTHFFHLCLAVKT